MGVLTTAGDEVGFGVLVLCVGPGVEPAVAGGARLVELRMERETLHSSLPARRLHRHAPPCIVDVEVEGYFSIVGHSVDGSAHVVDEEAIRAGLIDEQHGARGRTVDIG